MPEAAQGQLSDDAVTVTSTGAHRVVPMADWAAVREHDSSPRPSSVSTLRAPAAADADAIPPSATRNRSMSLSFPWRQRPKSSMSHPDDADTRPRGLTLQKTRSHGFTADLCGQHETAAAVAQVPARSPECPNHFKGILRRASLSVRSGVRGLGFSPRRTSVPAQAPPRHELCNKTMNSTWHRLRLATSFHRHSRHLLPPNAVDAQVAPPPGLIPGSGEQPPIIPLHTGAAARLAAATAQYEQVYNQTSAADSSSSNSNSSSSAASSPVHPSKATAGVAGALADNESGIGIALTIAEPEHALMPTTSGVADDDSADSDIDVTLTAEDGAAAELAISTVDFVARLPVELAIQVLANLDAAALTTAARVSKRWHAVVRNPHVWRESFLREKTGTWATSARVKPGAGLGVPPVRPGNDWREIYRAKEELDRRWRKGKARPVYLNGHSDSIYCLQFDEDKIITGSRDKTIRIWDMRTFACKLVIGPPEIVKDKAAELLYDDAGQPLHYATLPEAADPSAPTPRGLGLPAPPPPRAHASVPTLVSFPTHHKASILCLQYDDELLVTGSSDATCILYNLRSGYRPVRRLRHHTAAVLDLVFDAHHIVTCSKDVSICVWDRLTGALLKQLRGHTGPVNAVQMRGNTIVSCSGDFRVKLWNVDTGKAIREFAGHTKGLACSQFSEDGRYVASAGNDRAIRVWDANTGECLREMRAHENLVRSLHVDSVSGRLVSGSYDTDIKVWDVETGRQLLDFPKWHSSWVLSAKSDYRRIVSTGQDPKILIMDFGAAVKGIDMLESRGGTGAGLGVHTEEGGFI